MKLQRFTVQE